MATVVGVVAINVKTTAKKKKVRNTGRTWHCVGHFPGTASERKSSEPFSLFAFPIQEQLWYVYK